MNKLIFYLVFYLFFTPFGVISKLFGKQFIDLKWDKSKNSYWNHIDNNKKQNFYIFKFLEAIKIFLRPSKYVKKDTNSENEDIYPLW